MEQKLGIDISLNHLIGPGRKEIILLKNHFHGEKGIYGLRHVSDQNVL